MATAKLLKDQRFFAIKCDYFMWSEERGEYTEPVYWALDDNEIIVMEDDVNCGRLRVFTSLTAVKKYIRSHNTGVNICMENVRPVEIRYSFSERKWKEVE